MAVGLILTALLFLSLQDGLVKFVSDQTSLWQFQIMAIMGTMIFFFAGAPFLTLPEMGAGLYTYPVFMTVLSVIFLNEKVGVWRLTAVVLAALGAFLIFKPLGQSFHSAQILPILAGLFYSINAIILRKYCRSESPVTMATWASFGFLVMCTIGAIIIGLAPTSEASTASWPFILEAWPTLTFGVIGFALICAFCNVSGNVLIVKAYQSSELSRLAPVD